MTKLRSTNNPVSLRSTNSPTSLVAPVLSLSKYSNTPKAIPVKATFNKNNIITSIGAGLMNSPSHHKNNSIVTNGIGSP